MRKLYFLGVNTQKSAIFNIFPKWAKLLGINDIEIRGIDLPLHSPTEKYIETILRIIGEQDAVGIIITSHKVDLYKAAKDLFSYTDEYASLLGETSCISKRDGGLYSFAKDPVTSGVGFNTFINDGHFLKTGAEVAVLGAGGSAFSIIAYLLSDVRNDAMPSRIIIVNRSAARLEEAKKVFSEYIDKVNIRFELAPIPEYTDKIICELKPKSVVINATGLGKDRPGSPITDSAIFPENGSVWDFNYRGDLHFLKQAYRQKDKNLKIEDGWVYFVHNWLQCIKEAMNIEISSELYTLCFAAASEYRYR